MTASDHYPQIYSGLGGGTPIACLSAASCLWAVFLRLVWIWSVWVDMDDASDCQFHCLL